MIINNAKLVNRQMTRLSSGSISNAMTVDGDECRYTSVQPWMVDGDINAIIHTHKYYIYK
jgi:hypothetical protein